MLLYERIHSYVYGKTEWVYIRLTVVEKKIKHFHCAVESCAVSSFKYGSNLFSKKHFDN